MTWQHGGSWHGSQSSQAARWPSQNQSRGHLKGKHADKKGSGKGAKANSQVPQDPLANISYTNCLLPDTAKETNMVKEVQSCVNSLRKAHGRVRKSQEDLQAIDKKWQLFQSRVQRLYVQQRDQYSRDKLRLQETLSTAVAEEASLKDQLRVLAVDASSDGQQAPKESPANLPSWLTAPPEAPLDLEDWEVQGSEDMDLWIQGQLATTAVKVEQLEVPAPSSPPPGFFGGKAMYPFGIPPKGMQTQPVPVVVPNAGTSPLATASEAAGMMPATLPPTHVLEESAGNTFPPVSLQAVHRSPRFALQGYPKQAQGHSTAVSQAAYQATSSSFVPWFGFQVGQQTPGTRRRFGGKGPGPVFSPPCRYHRLSATLPSVSSGRRQSRFRQHVEAPGLYFGQCSPSQCGTFGVTTRHATVLCTNNDAMSQGERLPLDLTLRHYLSTVLIFADRLLYSQKRYRSRRGKAFSSMFACALQLPWASGSLSISPSHAASAAKFCFMFCAGAWVGSIMNIVIGLFAQLLAILFCVCAPVRSALSSRNGYVWLWLLLVCSPASAVPRCDHSPIPIAVSHLGVGPVLPTAVETSAFVTSVSGVGSRGPAENSAANSLAQPTHVQSAGFPIALASALGFDDARVGRRTLMSDLL